MVAGAEECTAGFTYMRVGFSPADQGESDLIGPFRKVSRLMNHSYLNGCHCLIFGRGHFIFILR